MPTPSARQVVLAARPEGKPQPSDFRLETLPVPKPGPGEVLLGVLYLSLDPYMRGRMDDRPSYAKPIGIGEVITGETVSRVLESRNPEFAEGDIVAAQTGWRTHAISDGQGLRKVDPHAAPITTALGVLGMPGFTAYVGLREIGKPTRGETLVVAAATGPVGSFVGQMARMLGARAIGVAGGPTKCAYAMDEFGFDAAVDHRSKQFPELLAAACPNGIDVYFENVGGDVWQAVLPLLNKFARVPVCGLISQYNRPTMPPWPDRLPATMRQVLVRSLTLRGFINYDFADQFPRFLQDAVPWVQAGHIRYREDIVDGLENAPQTFLRLFDGHNFGKLLIRVDTAS